MWITLLAKNPKICYDGSHGRWARTTPFYMKFRRPYALLSSAWGHGYLVNLYMLFSDPLV